MNKPETMPTLAATLEHAIDAGTTSVKSLALAGECDEETVARIVGRRQRPQLPKANVLRRWLRSSSHLPRSLKDAVAEWFLRGTDYRAELTDDADRTVLDANADGIVDVKDTMAHAIAASCGAAESLKLLLKAIEDGRATQAEKAQARDAFHHVEDMCRRARATIDLDGACSGRAASAFTI